MEEVNLSNVWYTIKRHKDFLMEARERTEITPDDNFNLYWEIMSNVCGTWGLDYNKDIAPKMRIAYVSKSNIGTLRDYCNTDRITQFIIIHNVTLYVGFDTEELAKYVLLNAVEMNSEFIEDSLYWYSEKLIGNARAKCPKNAFKVSDLRYNKYTNSKKVRWASILATYLHIISKRKMLARRADKRIKEFFNNK